MRTTGNRLGGRSTLPSYANTPVWRSRSNPSHAYDQSAAIWLQNTMPVRQNPQNRYDANSAVRTIREKSVTPAPAPPLPGHGSSFCFPAFGSTPSGSLPCSPADTAASRSNADARDCARRAGKTHHSAGTYTFRSDASAMHPDDPGGVQPYGAPHHHLTRCRAKKNHPRKKTSFVNGGRRSTQEQVTS